MFFANVLVTILSQWRDTMARANSIVLFNYEPVYSLRGIICYYYDWEHNGMLKIFRVPS